MDDGLRMWSGLVALFRGAAILARNWAAPTDGRGDVRGKDDVAGHLGRRRRAATEQPKEHDEDGDHGHDRVFYHSPAERPCFVTRAFAPSAAHKAAEGGASTPSARRRRLTILGRSGLNGHLGFRANHPAVDRGKAQTARVRTDPQRAAHVEPVFSGGISGSTWVPSAGPAAPSEAVVPANERGDELRGPEDQGRRSLRIRPSRARAHRRAISRRVGSGTGSPASCRSTTGSSRRA
jgi:hypothetical protein